MARAAGALPAVILAVLALAATGRIPTVKRGGERDGVAYAERFPEAKAALLRRINRDRAAHGVQPVAYDLLAAKVGDAFCLESARKRHIGHYDLAGRGPYLRWAEAGGVDYNSENFGAHSRYGGPITEPIEAMLREAHDSMMAEKPPDDGHRRTILEPIFTHVGIGCALVDGEFRMTEEFLRKVVEWVELPAEPLAAGTLAPVAFKLPSGWSAGPIEIAFEPAPRALTLAEAARRGGYSYPAPPIHRLMPSALAGTQWISGARGDFARGVAGRYDITVPLDHGPGNYYVMVYAAQGDVSGKRLEPVSGALVKAR